MGDILMSSPALNALKESFGCRITLLTSSMGRPITPYLPVIDETLVYDVPWVKSDSTHREQSFQEIVALLKDKNFDGAIVFNVFSQNPLPSVMLAYLAGIPNRLAYSRENPYGLLTDWVPDKEPYSFIQHQVRRDLELVRSIGATTSDDRIRLTLDVQEYHMSKQKLSAAGLDSSKPWIVCHPGVSEVKRQYPVASWRAVCDRVISDLGYQVVLTGTSKEKELAAMLGADIGKGMIDMTGKLSVGEFIHVINLSPLVVSVNTVTAHIAAATGTRAVILYAMTNPQHTPWKAYGAVLPFPVADELKSRNEVLRFVEETYYSDDLSPVYANDVFYTIREVLTEKISLMPELVIDHETIG